MAKIFHFQALVVLFYLFTFGYGQRTKDKMYEKIHGANGCYRRLNATHQIGGGSTGVVHYCETQGDLNYILKNGTAPPYIPVISTKLFTAETVEQIKGNGKVSGLIVYLEDKEKLDSFTHENQCPNPLTSVKDTCAKSSVWNPHGTGLLYADIPFPIFYVENQVEIVKIKDCFTKFNNFSYDSQDDRSLCSLELKSFMYATTNTPTCRRRSDLVTNLNPVKFCDPLGDSNVWATLFPLVRGKGNETVPIRDFKYIVIAARLDTTSMFEKTEGANNPITGLVTLLMTAKLLKDMTRQDESGEKNVLFMLFNGETYDYIGSQRMLYDMQQGDFPVKGLKNDNNILPVIRPDDISLFVELSQLGNSQGGNLYVHYYKNSAEITRFYEKLVQNQGAATLRNISQSLPPASVHSFLRNNSDFPGLIIADHEKSYTNPFYNSIYDNASNIAFIYYNATENNVSIPIGSIQQFVVNVSEMVAKSVYQELRNVTYTGTLDLQESASLADELLHCYLEDLNCKVHMATQKSRFPKAPDNFYVGVEHVSKFVTTLTALTLGWFTGDIEGKGDIDCTNVPKNYAFHYYNMSKSITDMNVTLCYKITMNTTEAVSPAFVIPGYDWSSGQYSTWTESTWAELGIRIFLKPSAAHEKMTIAIGSMTMIFFFRFRVLCKIEVSYTVYAAVTHRSTHRLLT
ncbi:hypothetical protein NQ317_018220 [Molorchus minor]|uniref:Nicastrin n=1 Tax=Molorchus minor TaxID=1323400 RepID=A0ABQ9K3M6_9CUCU|nr:hypothetical protein NQ317_018220 [Molorchus minor]